MKKVVLIAFSLFLVLKSGYNQELISEGNKWNNLIYKYSSFTIDNESLIVGNDTIIGESTYNKILRYINGRTDEISKIGYLRTTIDKKVFFRPDTASNDYLIYDFNVKKNDTLTVYGITGFNDESYLSQIDFCVNEIDSVSLSNSYYTRFHLSSIEADMNTDTWIDGIGNTNGFLHYDAGLVGGNGYKLLCFSDNDMLVYQNADFSSCDYLTSTNSIDHLDAITIYPNPLLDKSVISITNLNDSRLYRLIIFNTNGELIFESQFRNSYTLLRQDFNAGVYLIKITDGAMNIWTSKLSIK
jgi:hypothetical protein